MAVNVTNFLLSLATAMAAAVPPASPTVTVGTDLWVHDALEAASPAPYAVLRLYGGPPPEELWRIDNVSIQLAATSHSASNATRLAWQLYESLHSVDASGESKPRYAWQFAGYMLNSSGAVVTDPSTTYTVCLIVLAAPPGHVGVDQSGRQQVSFNFNARFAAVPTS